MQSNNRYQLAILLLAALPGSAQEKKRLDARDMFFSSVEMLDTKTPAQPPLKTVPDKSKPVPPKPVRRPPPELSAARKDPEAHFVNLKGTMLLGLRYSILLKTENGLVEVKPDRAFHSGDQIRVSVMGNQRGYLYIISRGTSGKSAPLFPNPQSDQSNEITAGRRYQVPGGEGEYFTFTKGAGEEHLFLMLSKTPVADLDEVIRSLGGPPEPDANASLRVLEARNRLGQDVDRLSAQVAVRDLEFTKTSSDGSQAGEEDAVYIVSKGSGNVMDARVVVDVKLLHR